MNTRRLIWFGKYAGTRFCDLPTDYLEWLLDNVDGEASELAEIELEKRADPDHPRYGEGRYAP